MSHPADYTTTTEPLAAAASTVDMYRTLAAAASEALPDPISITTHPGRQTVSIHIYAPHGDDQHVNQWHGWWTVHGASGWTARSELGGVAQAHHFVTGLWRGWRVELTWVTWPELESTPVAVAEPALAGAR
jgi:hypothetical protein